MRYTKRQCINCQQETTNPKFCCRSCAVSFTNKSNSKRKLNNKCIKCSKLIRSNRTYCVDCFPTTINNWEKITINEIQAVAKYQVSAYIRNIARVIYKKSDKPKCCCHCGYNKHYEVCHIKAINSFPKNTLVTTVNNLNNLIGLCPNCHWELDHGLLQLAGHQRIER